MNYVQRGGPQIVDDEPRRSAGGKHDARDWEEREDGRNANELAAQTIATRIVGQPLT